MQLEQLPECLNCQKGVIVPLQDFSTNGTPYIRGWCCTNPECSCGVIMTQGTIAGVDKERWK